MVHPSRTNATLAPALVGSELKLPNVATWWLGDPGARATALERLDELVIAPAFAGELPAHIQRPSVVGRELDKESRAALIEEIGRRGGLIDESAWSFVWVVDAPLFEPADEATAAGDVAVGSGAWTAVHHAFTSPKPDSMATFDTDPGSALAYAYDIVCNGNEIGGGSIRIHREDVQKRVFKVMGLTDEEASEKFGFLLDAFKFGAPPHGGIAFGIDRMVMVLAREPNLRDTVAFPKNQAGFDPMSGAPSEVIVDQLDELGLQLKPETKPGAGD